MASFLHSIYLPQKFDTDMRNNTLSSRVRNGKLSREKALEEYNSPPKYNKELLDYFLRRLGMDMSFFKKKMSEKPAVWTEFKTYKKRFERMRILFKYLSDRDLVPYSFYIKYCFKSNQ